MAIESLPSLEKAVGIVEKIIAERKRWGKAAGAAQYNQSQVIDALIVLFEGANVDGPSKADIARLNRQLGASNARHAAQQKIIDDLRGKLNETSQHRDALAAQLRRGDELDNQREAQLAAAEAEAGDKAERLALAERELHEAMTAVDVYSDRVQKVREYLTEAIVPSEVVQAIELILAGKVVA